MGSFKLKLVLYFAVLALLPVAAVFYGYDTLVKRSETRRVDARLEAGLRGSLAAYTSRLDEAERTARALAESPGLQHALRRKDRPALEAIASENPLVAISGGGVEVQGRRTVAAREAVDVIDHGRVLGTVVVSVPIDDGLLQAISSGLDPREALVAARAGRVIAGPHRGALLALVPGEAARVSLGGDTYRGLATAPLENPRGVELAAFAPASIIDSAAGASERRLLIGLVASLLLFGAVTYLLGRSIVRALARLAEAANAIARGRLGERVEVRGRDEFAHLAAAFNDMAAQLEQRLVELEEERHRLRNLSVRFGEALEATHDVEQLLRVIVETAVEATGAYGGVVVDGGRELARAGDPDSGLEKIAFPLRAGDSDFGSLVLSAPQFDNDDVEAAASLAANSVIALENVRLHRIVERQALVDGLTGLANRRALEETLQAELARAQRFHGELCLVLADLDDFKAVNDRYGHPAGDEVLREFATTLRETVREIDVAGRWGGEEFALILPGTDSAGGAALAERARRTLATRQIDSPEGDPIVVTSSFGVAALRDGHDVESLVAAADDALYRAKRAGKDRVVTAGEPVRQ